MMLTDRTIPPAARERMEKYRESYRAVHGEVVEISYRNGLFHVAGQRRGVSPAMLDQWTARLTQAAVEETPLRVCAQCETPEGEPHNFRHIAKYEEPAQDPEQRVTVTGKQLLLDGEHLADCRTETAAQVIAICLNAGRLDSRLPQESRSLVQDFFA